MNVSLGEVEAMARKAARGAGYAWGVADEAGFAIRWLETRGQGGVGTLARLLERVAGHTVTDFAPRDTTDWSSSEDHLCPIQTGSALADAARQLPNTALTLPPIMAPKILLPFLAYVASERETVLRVTCASGTADISGSGLEVAGDWTEASVISVSASQAMPGPCLRLTRATPDLADWRVLNRYASRTYAPATAASRLKGAGAGLTDND